MTKKCDLAGRLFVIRASSFLRHSSLELRHFKYDELASSLANPDRAVGERRSHHAVHPSMENSKQFDLNRGGAGKFHL
jgi:hypothetical protein